MAAFNKFNAFVADLAHKVHNLNTAADVLKAMLVNSPAPVAANSVKADLTEITAANGYAAGGSASTITGSSQASGTLTVTPTDVVITAAGGTIGPFRYPVAYNDTPVSPADPLIAWYDYGSSITLNDTETFTIDLTNLFTLA